MGHKLLAFRFLHPLSILSLLLSVFASPDYFLPDSPYSAWVFLINHAVLPPGLNCFCPSCSCQGTNRPHLSHPVFCPRQHHLMGHPKPKGLEPHMQIPSKPSDTSSGQGSPTGSLSAENALRDTWYQGHSATWPLLLCVYAQSPCACLLPAQQCQEVGACGPCVGLTHLQTPTLWLVMLCCWIDFSGGQRYLWKCKMRAWIPERLWLCMFMAFLCMALPLYSHLDLDSTLLNVCEPSIFHRQQVAILCLN